MQILCIGMQQTYGVTCCWLLFLDGLFSGCVQHNVQLIEFQLMPQEVMRGFIGKEIGRSRVEKWREIQWVLEVELNGFEALVELNGI
jgi:hypothetical protein